MCQLLSAFLNLIEKGQRHNYTEGRVEFLNVIYAHIIYIQITCKVINVEDPVVA
jgi:hypothetical protein